MSTTSINLSKSQRFLNAIKISHAKKDGLIVILGVGLTYISALIFDFSETFYASTAHYEYLQLDEIPFALFSFVLLNLWFSNRRLTESYHQAELRVETEKALFKSQQLYKKLFDESLTGNCVMDSDGNIEMYNTNFLSICGNNFPVQNAQNLLDEVWENIIYRLHKEKEIHFSKIKVNRNDKLVCYVAAKLILISDTSSNKSQSYKIHAFLADITEQCLAEQDLEHSLKENRQLALHAMKVQENERKFIASEIHDETGQYLSAIRLDSFAIRTTSKQHVIEIAKRIEANVEHIQKSVRSLIKHLRPPSLDANGLDVAVEHLVTEWSASNPNIYYDLSIESLDKKLTEEINIVAYRVIQEALTNINRHADAKWVKIKVSTENQREGSYLIIEVRDDGKGIDFDSSHSGIGLIGMRERVESVQGQFKILSGRGAGSCVFSKLPLV